MITGKCVDITKPLKLLIIYLLIIFPIAVLCMAMVSSGTVSLTLCGFGVDSSGKLYIGKESKIEVYENRELLYSIEPMTSRGYEFTVQKDDTLLLSTASVVYTLDLHGNVLSQTEDVGTHTFNELQHKRTFVTSSGDNYVLRFNWGRTKIVCIHNDTTITVYEMPGFDYVIKLLMVSWGASMVIVIPIVVLKSRGIIK